MDAMDMTAQLQTIDADNDLALNDKPSSSASLVARLASVSHADTFPRLLLQHAACRPNQPELISYARVLDRGRSFITQQPHFFEREIASGHADDLAVMLYTSGTTGKPKGVCHTHRSCLTTARLDCEFDALDAGDDVLSYLPIGMGG